MSWGAVPPTGWTGAWPPTDTCSALAALTWIQHPANNKVIVRYQQTAAGGVTNYGAGGANLPVTGPQGAAIAQQVGTIPPNLRSWLIRNLSILKTILYWTTDAKTPPANQYETLPAGGFIARDEQIQYLSFMPDPTSTDANVEIEFDYYDPTLP